MAWMGRELQWRCYELICVVLIEMEQRETEKPISDRLRDEGEKLGRATKRNAMVQQCVDLISQAKAMHCFVWQ